MARQTLLDDRGNVLPPDTATPTAPSFTSSPSSPDNYLQQLSDYAKSKGVTMEDSYAQDLARTYQGSGGQGARTAADVFDSLKAQIDRRAAPTSDRQVDSQSAQGNALYGSGSGNTTNTPGGAMTPAATPAAPAFQNTSPYFTDPTQRLVEDTALSRLAQLQNPDPHSGQGLYEQYAQQLADTLRQPPYSASDDAALKAQAFNALEQDRTSTHQRFMEELSRRGIPPSSGVALDGFRRIDQHYDQLRAAVTNQLAVNGISLAQQNRLQALDVLGGLAGTQNARLNQALTVSRIPYDLGTDAFTQMQQAVNAGGSPSANISTAIDLMTAIQRSKDLSASQRAYLLQQIGNMVGEWL